MALLPWIVLGGLLLLFLAILRLIDHFMGELEHGNEVEEVEDGSGGFVAEAALEVGLWVLLGG